MRNTLRVPPEQLFLVSLLSVCTHFGVAVAAVAPNSWIFSADSPSLLGAWLFKLYSNTIILYATWFASFFFWHIFSLFFHPLQFLHCQVKCAFWPHWLQEYQIVFSILHISCSFVQKGCDETNQTIPLSLCPVLHSRKSRWLCKNRIDQAL